MSQKCLGEVESCHFGLGWHLAQYGYLLSMLVVRRCYVIDQLCHRRIIGRLTLQAEEIRLFGEQKQRADCGMSDLPPNTGQMKFSKGHCLRG